MEEETPVRNSYRRGQDDHHTESIPVDYDTIYNAPETEHENAMDGNNVNERVLLWFRIKRDYSLGNLLSVFLLGFISVFQMIMFSMSFVDIVASNLDLSLVSLQKHMGIISFFSIFIYILINPLITHTQRIQEMRIALAVNLIALVLLYFFITIIDDSLFMIYSLCKYYMVHSYLMTIPLAKKCSSKQGYQRIKLCLFFFRSLGALCAVFLYMRVYISIGIQASYFILSFIFMIPIYLLAFNVKKGIVS